MEAQANMEKEIAKYNELCDKIEGIEKEKNEAQEKLSECVSKEETLKLDKARFLEQVETDKEKIMQGDQDITEKHEPEIKRIQQEAIPEAQKSMEEAEA